MLGRFPRRNRFISDYIFDKTGKRRSPKQVGSRLQQLRESCGGQQCMPFRNFSTTLGSVHFKVLHLLSPFRSPAPSAHSASADGTVHRLTPPVDGGLLPGSLSPSHVVMYIDILPQGSPERSRPGSSSSAWSDAGDVVRASEHPRPLESINPTICFTSTSSMVAHSRFTVYSEDLILHAETVPLLPLEAQAPQTSGVLYSTLLVPKYWKVILDSPGAHSRFVPRSMGRVE
jgi:transcriptional enhancer factor